MALLRSAISGRLTRNRHSRVVDEIGSKIVGGVYQPGETLPGDAELAQTYQVSRTVLRETMKTLSAKGMVVARARIGTRVTERESWNLFDADVLRWHFRTGVDLVFLGHLCDMRRSFEPFAARLAARHATQDQVSRLLAAADAMRDAKGSEAFALADLDLHMTLLEASGNPFMHSVANLIEAALASAFEMSSPAEHPGQQRSSADAHRDIAEAIRARDADAAAAAVDFVILDGLGRITERLKRDKAAGASNAE